MQFVQLLGLYIDQLLISGAQFHICIVPGGTFGARYNIMTLFQKVHVAPAFTAPAFIGENVTEARYTEYMFNLCALIIFAKLIVIFKSIFMYMYSHLFSTLICSCLLYHLRLMHVSHLVSPSLSINSNIGLLFVMFVPTLFLVLFYYCMILTPRFL